MDHYITGNIVLCFFKNEYRILLKAIIFKSIITVIITQQMLIYFAITVSQLSVAQKIFPRYLIHTQSSLLVSPWFPDCVASIQFCVFPFLQHILWNPVDILQSIALSKLNFSSTNWINSKPCALHKQYWWALTDSISFIKHHSIRLCMASEFFFLLFITIADILAISSRWHDSDRAVAWNLIRK